MLVAKAASQFGEITGNKTRQQYVDAWKKVKQTLEDTTSPKDKLIPN